MRFSPAITRVLMVILVLRVIAAPVTLRPKRLNHGYRTVLTYRHCSWPPQRHQRFSSHSKLLQLLEGKGKIASSEPDRRALAHEPWSFPRSHLSSLSPQTIGDSLGTRTADGLRC